MLRTCGYCRKLEDYFSTLKSMAYVILSESKNLGSALKTKPRENSQRCFAPLNMTEKLALACGTLHLAPKAQNHPSLGHRPRELNRI